LDVLVDDAEIARRRAVAPKWVPRASTGWLKRYALVVGNASSGASMLD
jgi:dihydroxyacid dehydratase/phosphogluconate dehydratase